ncbi:hypothetical protein JAAARDRAFT_194385 [Jaapia argillacea MUCL 33604]|uniref:Deacetylase sirtuin-type domain-containing protein n=1 Tax=Jaapia argillacea MUCL 33604 TaxID=933084 RepID=A0A067Q152_9AGAM|nr:hypothetical protein JAAARDRAFT_194385 [Jaapia argillacea MUCL 33604]
MTICLPLEASSPFPQSPSFLVPSSDPQGQLTKVLKTILKAKRIAVVCGAGISVQAGIPDFRSSDGLFQTLKRDNPKEALASGRDLFDASVFNSEHTTSLFCQMISRLSELSQAASPTPFHKLLRTLDDRGRLLRVYTQNIDALESKSGLSFGVPEFDDRRNKAWSPKSKLKFNEIPQPNTTQAIRTSGPSTSSSSRLPSPPAETPRCIPLHGTLQEMHCQSCNHSFPLADHIESLSIGVPPPCPECTALEATRAMVGKRSRGVGKLRPSVVLYNEMHKDGEGVGEVVRKDLVGGSKGKGRAGADVLVVVGTSLRVPGTKRIVREFSKAVRSRMSGPGSKDGASHQGLLTPSATPPRRSSPMEDEQPLKTIYLNLDFPVPTREWEGVFDVWIKGDAQMFANMLVAELEKEDRAKELAFERKKRREEEVARKEKERLDKELEEQRKKSKKRKRVDIPVTPPKPSKRRKAVAPPPPSSPSKSKTGRKGKAAPPSKRTKPSSASQLSASGKVSQGTHPRIIIRIPPRKTLMAEVLITKTLTDVEKAKYRQWPTPSPSPPASKATSVRPSSGWSGGSDSDSDLTILDDDEEDGVSADSSNPALSGAFVKAVQCGLRGSGG